ncbi:MAG: efflux RND transporter periplasmic adaptor subunit [Flavobacteriales bacterium]|nr:efflux RND transporter periplasmic adaptor subunit [Flavobacteriales bacterium]MBK7940425.1 efflux RND transporter periplasmic adaptor subunit [Flavobacteriales bacterium]MBK9699414.1 efflux RND transporter periplasmic adaptor subunit [Flavobacteriales bacterium]
MRKSIPFVLVAALLHACHDHPHPDQGEHGHDHAAGADHHVELEPLAYTLYSDSIELFVEFKPLVVGQESRFAAHFTHLRSVHVPLTQGSASVAMKGIGAPQVITADAPSSPGIFRMAVTPAQEGSCSLTFIVNVGNLHDTLTIGGLRVYSNEHEAQHAEQPEDPPGDITYLKEQAWKIPFALARVDKSPFAMAVRVGAEVEPAIAGEEVITARSAGVVHLFGDAPLEGMAVTKGRTLFTLSSQGVIGGSGTAMQQARNEFERAKADLERTEALYKDKLVTQEEVLRVRNVYANAEVMLQQSGSAQNVSAGINGYVRSLHVKEGQFVQPGDVLARIATNERLSIHADVPLRSFADLGSVEDARIRLPNGEVRTLEELNGRVQSVGRAADGLYVPVRLEVNGVPGLLPGAMVDVWLLSPKKVDALTIPLSALLEQEGRNYCYVQSAGETMDKRMLTLGGNDGLRAEVRSGLRPGERVVSIGALDVKLATASGAMPAHGHEH